MRDSMRALPTQSRHSELISRVRQVRALTEKLCDPLAVEDFGVQSIPDVSPPKWHLAHTSWFFEQFLLSRHIPGYRPYHPEFAFLFNSYYESVGEHVERSRRGLLSRPTVQEVFRYRCFVDSMLEEVPETEATRQILELGLEHEQQHQELLLTDIKHILWTNHLRPVYRKRPAPVPASKSSELDSEWLEIDEGLYEIGFDEEDRFCFDNEKPRHPVYLNDFEIQGRLVTNAEFIEFIEAGGYEAPRYWLSQGWDLVRLQHWKAPLYWSRTEEGWTELTLLGVQPVEREAPVSHVSYYEADAFARWRGARLPTEAEWEVAAQRFPIRGSFLESEAYHPQAARVEGSFQFWGELWQWTSSAYAPYPGFRPLPDAFSEYNGKFMSNQMVLRGGSCATPHSHIRATYRNFFPPDARWQFSGIRLAR